jgi:hypothetical protein
MRMGGTVIWATDFRERRRTRTQGGGKGGGGGKVRTTEYLYHASFAVALCEGAITGIGRIWADGKPMDLAGVTWRWYPGDEEQEPDPFIAAKMGAAATPAYRGTAYVVFEELPLGRFGNRLPQLSFEVFRPLADPDTAEGLTQAVTLIPPRASSPMPRAASAGARAAGPRRRTSTPGPTWRISSRRSTGCRPWRRRSRASASSSPGSATTCARAPAGSGPASRSPRRPRAPRTGR